MKRPYLFYVWRSIKCLECLRLKYTHCDVENYDFFEIKLITLEVVVLVFCYKFKKKMDYFV